MVAAILLAGGESRRMGKPKPLLEWGGTTLIEYQLAELEACPIDETIVVLGHRAEEVLAHVQGAGRRVIVNEQYRRGRASSLRLAAATLPDDTEAVVILSVDQPRPRAMIAALVEAHLAQGNLITAPTYRGRRGHPPVLSGRLLPELREVDEETQGLREVMRRHAAEVAEVSFDNPAVLVDINEPGEYNKARASYSP